MEFLLPIVPAFAMLSFAIIIKAVIDNLVRLKIANKDNPPKESQKILKQKPTNPRLNLKWGFVLAALGIAMLVNEFILNKMSTVGTFGLMFLFAGLGFLIYFIVAKKELDNKKNEVTVEK